MGLQGDLERFSLPEIFQLLGMGRKSGKLEVQGPDNGAVVQFREGNVTFATMVRKRLHFGELLIEEGKITPEQLEKVLELQDSGDRPRRLGTILVEQGLLTEEALRGIVSKQTEEMIYDVLTWPQGTFKFSEGDLPATGEVAIEISTENLILEAMRRVDEIARFQQRLPAFDTVLGVSEAPEGRDKDVRLKPEEWNVLRLVNGRHTINDIVAKSKLDRFETCRALAGLQMAGLVEPAKTDGPVDAARLEDMVAGLTSLLERYLKAK